MKRRILIFTSLLCSIAACGVWLVRAQETLVNPGGPEFSVAHAECTYFGPQLTDWSRATQAIDSG